MTKEQKLINDLTDIVENGSRSRTKDTIIALIRAALASYAEQAPQECQVTGKSAGKGGYSKEDLCNMLEDVVNALDLSEFALEQHGPLGTPPAELVKLVLEQKDKQIRLLKAGFKQIDESGEAGKQPEQQEINTGFLEGLKNEPFNVIRNMILKYLDSEQQTALLRWLTPEQQPAVTLGDVLREEISFSDQAFGKNRPFTGPLHHLKKEIQEVLDADTEPYDPTNGSLIEFADCQLLLLDAFRRRHPDLSADDLLRTCMNKISINRKRKWGMPDKNGVVEHIRDEGQTEVSGEQKDSGQQIYEDYRETLKKYAIVSLMHMPIVKKTEGGFKWLSDDITDDLFVVAGFCPDGLVKDAFEDFEFKGVDKEGIWCIEALLSYQEGEGDVETGYYQQPYMLIEYTKCSFVCSIEEAGEQKGGEA